MKKGFTLAVVLHALDRRKAAFTLAEVLITLGIIGFVAAMTLPALVGSYRKHLVETRLEKFYSIMNQAVKSAEAEYGEFQYWGGDAFDAISSTGIEEWYNKYFRPYIKTLRTEATISSKVLWVYLAAGTKFEIFNYLST